MKQKLANVFLGVYVWGDIQDAVYRQDFTAAFMGCSSTIDVERYLETLH